MQGLFQLIENAEFSGHRWGCGNFQNGCVLRAGLVNRGHDHGAFLKS